jgi:phage major head subunit gpT-like protein
MSDDDQYGYIRKLPGMLSEAFRKTEETVAHGMLNNGFGTQTAADGLSLFNTAHVTMDGSETFQNRPTVAADLTQTALENAEIAIGNWPDERGLPISAMAKTLVVPVDQKFTAEKILGTKFEVDTNNNTINPMAGKYRVVVSPYLTDTDAWFLITDVPEGLIFQRRAPAEMNKDGEFTTLNMRFSIWGRFGVGAINARCAYGSPGA